MRVPSPTAILFCSCLLLTCFSSRGLTLDELRRAQDLTPAKFTTYFADFEFKFRADIQQPETFLSTRSGDCDDYSILAAQLLQERGYTPRLIAVRMPKIVHVVCYIEETKSYLDYNHRSEAGKLIVAGNEIADIAASVANSYGEKWSSASEFTFDGEAKRLVKTVLNSKRNRKG